MNGFIFAIDPPIGELTPFKLVRRSICPCGFPIVQESVPDGKVYMIEKWTLWPYTMICGGCGKQHDVKVGMIVEDGKRTGKMLIDGFEEMPVQAPAAGGRDALYTFR